MRFLLLLILMPAMLGQSAPPPAETPAEPAVEAEAETETLPQRVVIRVSRRQEIAGYVELEDEDLIVIRREDGEMASFTKTRIAKIIRLVDPRPGQKGTVYLRNGQVTTGEILEDAFEQVVVKVEGIPIAFRRTAVEEVELEPTFEQLYERMKAALQPNMFGRRLDLCRWLIENRRYDLAEQELEALLKTKPDMVEAGRLLRVVRAQINLDQPGGDDTPAPATMPESTEPRRGPVTHDAMLPTELISRDDVNLMRVYEIDFNHPPKLAIKQDTIRTLIENYGSSNRMPTGSAQRTALFRADPLYLVREFIFPLKARELYGEVQVLSEPRALNLFRQRVHNTWLMNNCSTSRCHGGPHAGRFFLHRRNYKDERVRYTNLLILERLDLEPGWPLINYNSPGDSLIIQYGLPRVEARKPHPDVPHWKPVFTKGNTRLREAAVEWIGAMMQPRPDYPVEYEPPMLIGDTLEPATADEDSPDGPGRTPR